MIGEPKKPRGERACELREEWASPSRPEGREGTGFRWSFSGMASVENKKNRVLNQIPKGPSHLAESFPLSNIMGDQGPLHQLNIEKDSYVHVVSVNLRRDSDEKINDQLHNVGGHAWRSGRSPACLDRFIDVHACLPISLLNLPLSPWSASPRAFGQTAPFSKNDFR